MASVLHKFEEKTKILASKVNENFEFLQEDIATLTDSVDSKLSSNKESILSDIETVKTSLEESLQGLEDLPHIIKVSDKSILPDFYMIYSNGLCYQSGSVTVSTSLELELLIPYLDTNYNASASTTQWRWEDSNGTITGKTNSTIKFKALRWRDADATTNTSLTFDWHTLGYINLEELEDEL